MDISGFSFLPNPPYIETFKKEVKSKFFKAGNSGKFNLLMLDTLDLITNSIKAEDWSIDEKIQLLKEYSDCPIWDDEELWEDLNQPQEVLASIERYLDAIAHREEIAKAITADFKKIKTDLESALILKHSRTYQVKEEIKKLGGKYNPLHKAWDMPSQEAYDRAWEMCEKCN